MVLNTEKSVQNHAMSEVYFTNKLQCVFRSYCQYLYSVSFETNPYPEQLKRKQRLNLAKIYRHHYIKFDIEELLFNVKYKERKRVLQYQNTCRLCFSIVFSSQGHEFDKMLSQRPKYLAKIILDIHNVYYSIVNKQVLVLLRLRSV